jgi:serine/threonine protein kinase
LNDEENRSGGDGGSRALFGGSYSDDLSFSQLHDSYPTMAQMISMQDLLMKRGSVGLSGYYLANHSRPHLAESVQRLTINPDDCTLMTGRAVIALPGFLKIDYHGDLRPARVVAEGGGGVVYEAELMNEHLQFKYQTKLVAVKLVKNPGSWTDEETLANFRQEVSIMWSLHEHPNIMPILGYTEEPMGIVMPYYAFGMMDIIRGKQCEQILTDDNVLRYIHQLASAMQTMHHLNIVHRDLKTQNLLVDAPAGSDPMFWRVILSDFGLSKPLESGGVEAAVYTNAIGLSYRYAAPELFGRMQQMNASRMSILIAANQQNSNLAPEGWIEKKADCFAFAIIMWEIFERSPSWPTNSNAEIGKFLVS